MNSAQRVAARYLAAYEDEGWVGDYWGRAGAGIMFTTGERILLLKRAWGVDQPGTWGIPGGALPVEGTTRMAPLKGARREVKEEVGSLPSHRVKDKFVYRDGSFTFTTFIAQIENEFTPRLNWENDDFRWVTREELSALPLHFGVKALLASKDPFQM